MVELNTHEPTWCHAHNSVYNILKAWVTNHWHDFEDDKQFLQQFLQFVRGDLKQTMEHAAEALDQLIQRAVRRALT